MKCLIFDLDGTLGNTLPLCIAAFKKAIEPLAGRSISDAEIIATFGPSEEGTVQALIPERYDQGIADYLRHYLELHAMCETPFEGMTELLAFAHGRGVPMALVTGKGERSTVMTLARFGIESYFQVIETGSPQGPRKVQGIQEVIKQLDVAPRDCVYIGDAPSDIQAAREAGVAIVAAAWAETADPALLDSLEPDRLFTSVADFGTYLRQAIL
ncbi:HAD family hydrolase [Paenibacillus glycinis]|uniref:HAD-IA family hydrolase n=1 Tax=Paenibacillus glycinis TaxID=2697035 RepID=A0ABW9XQE7_9BACL|nr:HAD family hydrolase [Paenibacillus glycinis]NBD24878.1 HAD-IA family hydrolase [Paenibacillus glycinis]